MAVGRQDSYLTERRTLLSPERVRELSKTRPRRAVADTTWCWALILGAWAGAAVLSTWWAIAIAFVLVGNRYYALFIVAHDGLHRRLFPTTAANDRFCDLALLGPIGAITRINNRNHLLHHQYLSTEDDPDRHKHTCLNKGSNIALVAYITSMSSITRSVGHVFLHSQEDTTAAVSTPKASHRPRDLAILVAWQALLFGGLTLAFGWWAYIVLWWLPVFTFAFLADNLRTFLEHSQTEADEVADQHRLVTNYPGWIERQLLAPMNMHYHAAHHLWPSIPYYNLPIADAEMRAAPGNERITWRGSYFAYLWRYSRALPIKGCSRPAGA